MATLGGGRRPGTSGPGGVCRPRKRARRKVKKRGASRMLKSWTPKWGGLAGSATPTMRWVERCAVRAARPGQKKLWAEAGRHGARLTGYWISKGGTPAGSAVGRSTRKARREGKGSAQGNGQPRGTRAVVPFRPRPSARGQRRAEHPREEKMLRSGLTEQRGAGPTESLSRT